MVLTKIITNSFLKTGITNALDGSEDNMLCVGDKNVDAEGRVNWRQRAVPRMTVVLNKIIMW
jgi:hypothetical protein